MDLLNKSKENIETITGLSIDNIKRIPLRSLEFYLQNVRKISLESSGEEVYFKIKNKRLRRDINKVLLRKGEDKTDSFLEKEIGEYLIRINYYGFPIEKGSKINGFPIGSFENINKKLGKISRSNRKFLKYA